MEMFLTVLAVAVVGVSLKALTSAWRAGLSQVSLRALLLVGVWAWAVPLIPIAGVVYFENPQLLLLLGLAVLFFFRRGIAHALWSKGTSRWADHLDLLGNVFRPDGIPLGRISPPTIRSAIRLLRVAPLARSFAACLLFFAALQRKPVPVSGGNTVHAAFFAPAGAGKSTSIVIPFLLSSVESSAVVIDVKGELFKASASVRKNAGHRIVILDPFHVVTSKPDCLNPLDMVDVKNRHALDDIRSIAESIVIKTGEEKEPHWNDGAEMFITGVTGLVKAELPRATNLQEVAEILASPDQMTKALTAMKESYAFGGLLARTGDQLGHFREEELGSVMTTTARHLRFLATPAVVESTTRSTFDPRDIARGKMTVYLVLPPDKLATQNALLRLWINTFIRAVVQSGLKRDKKINFILDEAAALGRMEAIENAITQLRGYGVNLTFFYQSLGQLKKVYREGQEQTFLSNMSLTSFFSVNDYETADHVSRRLGSWTLRLVSGSGGWSRSRNENPQGLDTASTSWNDGWSEQETDRELLKPDEVCRLPPDQAICFMQGTPPALVTLTPYYSPAFRITKPVRFWWRCLAFSVLSLALAGLASLGLFDRWDQHRRGQPGRPPQFQTPGVHPPTLHPPGPPSQPPPLIVFPKPPGIDFFREQNIQRMKEINEKTRAPPRGR